MGFVGGKQSCIGLLQANVFYRGYLTYTHTHLHIRSRFQATFASTMTPARGLHSCTFLFRSPCPIDKLYFSRSLRFVSKPTNCERARTPRDVSSALGSRAVCCTDGAFTLHFITRLARISGDIREYRGILRNLSTTWWYKLSCDVYLTTVWSIVAIYQSKLSNETMAFSDTRISLFLLFKTSQMRPCDTRSGTTGG